VEVGESVNAGQPLMSGLSLEKLRVVVNLPQQIAGLIRQNPKASVLVNGNQIEPLKITIFPVADTVTNTFTVRLELPDGQFDLYPGMFVKVAFLVSEADRLLLPASTILRRSEVTAVYVVDRDRLRFRQVRIGRLFGDRVEILAGVEAGEQVSLDPVAAGIFIKTARQD
jgi:multidrug efflux pump subunit AcrA (membrane-fusion protein)